MASARAKRTQTKNWIMGLHQVSAEVANGSIDQGVALSELGGLDPSEIGIICSANRKPGETIDDPKDARGTDPMPKVQNTGMKVPVIHQLNLSVSVTSALHYEDIGRPIIPRIMNWAIIRQFRSFTISCKEWEDPTDIPAGSKDVFNIQVLELVTEHLRSKLGVHKTLLSYVTRDDPTVHNIGTISVTFPYPEVVDSFPKELITRSSQNHPNFADNNGMVLDGLVAFLKTSRHMSDLKPFQKRRDGRGPLEALELHNMGNSKWDSIVSEAESKVPTFKWNGNNSRYTLAHHISSHRSSQNDMARAEDHIVYHPPNEYT